MNTEEKLIHIILIRHGLMEYNKLPDEHRHLSLKGREQVDLLGTKLASRNLSPRVFFTSPYPCSQQTADILKNKLGGKLVSLEKLEPYKERITFNQLIKEINNKIGNLEAPDAPDMVAFVGQNPSLWDLMCSLTKDKFHVLKPAEAVGFQGTFKDFCKGKGKFEFREVQNINEIGEIEANPNHRIEEQLRSKITSTMTVSTFLAGFTFAILNDLLKNDLLKKELLKTKCSNIPQSIGFIIPQSIAAILMIMSLSFFIASLYMYDNMAMPKEYWPYRRDRASFYPHHKRLRDYMIKTWNWVFTPGVVCFICGFIATLFKIWEKCIPFRGTWVVIVVFAFIIVATTYLVHIYRWLNFG